MKRLLVLALLFVSFISLAQTLLVRPYLQPGDEPTLSKEQKVVIWQTDSVPGNFKVEFAPGATLEGAAKISSAKITFTQLKLLKKTTRLYRASMTDLSFDTEYTYRVVQGDMIISTAKFNTRTLKPETRFAVFGDCGTGSPSQSAISFHVYQQKPQFVLVVGDLVYSFGLEREYRARFFPAFTNPVPTLRRGAPLMQSVPFYMFLGNHDTYGADLEKYPDGLAYFYYSDVPMNGPTTKLTVDLTGSKEQMSTFRKATEGRFPKLANYSFDHGNVHITCLDSNPHADPQDPALLEWIKNDIGSSKAEWKIVSFHHPGFNTGKTHYDDQRMRVLSPLFEELGVSLVLSGHIHNYQRSIPFTFAPKKNKSGKYVVTDDGRVDGVFTMDTEFDGVTKTVAKGIVYVISGGGGAGLYDPEITEKPDLWKHRPKENWVNFMSKVISDVHTFTLIETNGKTLILKQFDDKAEVIDEIKVTR